MNCQLCQKEMDAYHEDRLPRDTRTKVDAHLETCKECAEIFRVQTLADRVINQEKGLLSNPFLSTRIMTRIENLETPEYNTIPILQRVLRPAIITASLAIAIFFGVMMGNIYQPAGSTRAIPIELALIDDAAIESVNILLNE